MYHELSKQVNKINIDVQGDVIDRCQVIFLFLIRLSSIKSTESIDFLCNCDLS